MSRPPVVAVFLAFALAYFFSAVLRAVTATLAPTLTQTFSLSPSDLGLLAGGYFLGFAAMQLPLGKWLDRFGPKKVVLAFLSVAVVGSAAFAMAEQFATLLLARVLCGVGVCACLMAPLTAYRRWFAPELQLRTNSWMLMSGSLGMVASTLPVAYLLPVMGWRGLFWMIAGLLLLCMLLIWRWVPTWTHAGESDGPAAAKAGSHSATAAPAGADAPAPATTYRAIFAHPYFRKMAGIGFFNYGGMIGIQSLWAGPWMAKVGGLSASQAASGLFWVNVCMLFSFMLWGWLNPGFARRGWRPEWLIARGLPLSLISLALAITLGVDGHWLWWALFCTTSTFTSLTQPAVGMAFDAKAAGRALSAYNLVIFGGVFTTQWGIGLAIDAGLGLGWPVATAYTVAFAAFGLCCVGAFAQFLLSKGK